MGDRMSREQAMRLLNAMSDGFAMAVVAGTGVRLEKENIPQLCTAVATAITLLSQQEEDNPHASLLLMIHEDLSDLQGYLKAQADERRKVAETCRPSEVLPHNAEAYAYQKVERKVQALLSKYTIR